MTFPRLISTVCSPRSRAVGALVRILDSGRHRPPTLVYLSRILRFSFLLYSLHLSTFNFQPSLRPNSFPLIHLIIYLANYCTSMVTSCLIVRHHPRRNALYPASPLPRCLSHLFSSNSFLCHTSAISHV